MIDNVRNWVVTHSRNNTAAQLPTTAAERREILTLSAVDAACFAANGVGAGSPAAYVTGSATIVYGGLRGLRALCMGMGFRSTDTTPMKQEAKAAAALIAGGATAFIPVMGQLVNLKMAVWTGVEAACVARTPLRV